MLKHSRNMQRCYQTRTFIDTVTGVDLSKILDGQFKILGEKVVKTDKCMVVSQLLGAYARAAPQVYAYGYNQLTFKKLRIISIKQSINQTNNQIESIINK